MVPGNRRFRRGLGLMLAATADCGSMGMDADDEVAVAVDDEVAGAVDADDEVS